MMAPRFLNPNDWAYVAEGGKHVVYAFCGNSSPKKQKKQRDVERTEEKFEVNESDYRNSEENTFIYKNSCDSIFLRVQKEHMLMASVLKEDSISTFGKVKSDGCSTVDEKQIVRSLLGSQYVDFPLQVYLPHSFVRQLYRRTVESGVIPPARLVSWTATTKRKCENYELHDTAFVIPATMIRNYTVLPSSIISASASPSSCVSIEIKPKAGYISKSPLIHPQHTCKHYKSRFYLQQYLMKKGYLRKGWQQQEDKGKRELKNSEIDDKFEMSSYSPLDLFSRNVSLVEKAVQSLMKHKQNNMKIWYNGSLFWSDVSMIEGHIPKEKDCREVVQSLFPAWFHHIERFCHDINKVQNDCDDKKESIPSWKQILELCLQTVTSKILHSEPLLQNLLQLQKLDVVDADGAILIYERLVSLCHGSNEEAERLIDNREDTTNMETSAFECNTADKQETNIFSKLFSIPVDTNDGKSAAISDRSIVDCCPICTSSCFQPIHLLLQKRENCDAEIQQKVIKYLFLKSPYVPPPCPILFNLCCEILEFRSNLLPIHDESNNNVDGDDRRNPFQNKATKRSCRGCIDKAHQRSKSFVEKMSKDGCIYLLQNWLLS